MWSGSSGARDTEKAEDVFDLLPEGHAVKGAAGGEWGRGWSRPSDRGSLVWQCASWALILLVLYLVSLQSYLLFHSIAELFSIVIAFGLFVVAWNSRAFLDNNSLLFIGLSYLFVAFVDSIHTLAYKGMGVFTMGDTNLPAQLWIVARYMQSISLLVAPFFLKRRLRIPPVFAVYALATVLSLLAIFSWEIFPDSFIEGTGLTPFKWISEYVICLLLAGSILFLLQNRWAFDPQVLLLIVGSIGVTILSEVAFTLYVSAYGLANLVGHYAKILAFFLMYKAIIETGLTRPFRLLFRELKQSEEALRRARDNLERRVKERTAELVATNEALQREIIEHRSTEEALQERGRILEFFFKWTLTPLVFLDRDFNFIRVNEAYARACQRDVSEFPGHNHFEFYPSDAKPIFEEVVRSKKPFQAIARPFVFPDHPEWGVTYWDWTLVPVLDSTGEVELLVFSLNDVTERKRAEQALHARTRQLEAVREIGTEIARELELARLLQLITQRAGELIGTGTGTVWLWDEEAQELVPHVRLGERPWMNGWRVRLGEGVAGTVAQRREGLVVNDYRNWRHALPLVLVHSGIMAVLAEPLLYRDRLLGVIAVDNEQSGRPFTEEDRSLLALFATHIAIAIANAQLFGEVRAARERLRNLSRRLVEMQEADRRHIARELHDEIGQALTGLKLVLAMGASLPADAARQSYADAQELISDLLARVREMSLDLRPAILDDLGLLPTLVWYMERYTARTGVRVTFKHTVLEGRRFAPEVETGAYRVVQEALTNVARHAGVREATVRLWAGENCLGAQVEDRGKGFDPEATLAAGLSGGLSGMRERAELLGGRLMVESSPGLGTLVAAEFPLRYPGGATEKAE